MASVIILGGGIAGLSAAHVLAPFHRVTVLEPSTALGGLGGSLSCKAGADCSVCSACTLPDLASSVMSELNVTVRTGLDPATIGLRVGSHVDLRGAGDRFEGDALIVATGMDVTDGSWLSEYSTDREGVVTALDMDRMLRGGAEGGQGPPLPGKHGSVAIIQCVCSRDTGELPYCSRVCCAYSARLALELRDLYPSVEVTVFYMDLQREDAVTDRQIDIAMATKGIVYTRSRPASVQPVPGGGLEVTYEDTLTGEIASATFDMVVLSTGVVPSEGTRSIVERLGLGSDEHGFISVIDGPPGATTLRGVFAAGGATGPVDLVEASMGGMAAAAAVLADLPPQWDSQPPRVVVVGEGEAADASHSLARAAGASASVVRGLPGRGLRRLLGEPLGFQALMGAPGAEAPAGVEGDVVVVDPVKVDEGPSSLPGAMTLGEMASRLAEGGLEEAVGGTRRFALVTGRDPRAMELAAALVERLPGSIVDVLFEEMAVAASGHQELQLELADLGVRFHRCSSPRVAGEGPYTVTFTDQLAPEVGPLALEVDAVAAPGTKVDAGLVWPWFLSRYAPEGVPAPQRLNVLPVLTPRRGVFTTTPAGRTGAGPVVRGAAAAALALADYARGFPLEPQVALVDGDKCAACLNCLRVCPHDAIAYDEEARAAVILARACQACGMCIGICPAEAIAFVDSGSTGGG